MVKMGVLILNFFPNSMGTYIPYHRRSIMSPVVPATLLACGLAGVGIKDHIKRSFFIIGVLVFCV